MISILAMTGEIYTICNFRTSNHSLPIEKGIYSIILTEVKESVPICQNGNKSSSFNEIIISLVL